MSTPGSETARPLLVVPALAVTVLGVAAMFVSGALAPRTGAGLRAQIAAGTVALAVPALLALVLSPLVRRAAIGSGPLTSRTVGLSGLLGAALWVASIGLMEMQSLLVPPTPEYLDAFRAIHRALAPEGVLDGLVSLAVIAVLPGLCEELVVRGVLLPSLLTRAAPAPAVVGSALFFAVMHADPYRFLFTFTVGLALGAVRVRTGSLWPPVVAHVALNTLTFLVAPLLDDPAQPYTPQPLLGLACLVAGAAAAWPLLRALAPVRPSATA